MVVQYASLSSLPNILNFAKDLAHTWNIKAKSLQKTVTENKREVIKRIQYLVIKNGCVLHSTYTKVLHSTYTKIKEQNNDVMRWNS